MFSRPNLLSALVSMALSVCAAAPASAQQPLLRDFRWTGAVPAGSSLSVDNAWGDVRLRAGGTDRRVEVLGSLQPGEEQAVAPDVRVTTEPGVLAVRVVVSPVHQGLRSPRADLVLFVPEGVAVAVRTQAGLIEAKGLRGDATLVAERGDILAKGIRGALCARSERGTVTAELETASHRSQSLESLTGDLTAYLWEDASVTVEAATSGEISTDFTLHVEYLKSQEPNKRAVAVLGTGEARLHMESKEGRVRILRLPRSFRKEGPDAPKPDVSHP